MLLPHLSLIPLLATLTTTTQSLNTISPNASLLTNLPNPYPVPGTSVTIDFDALHHKPLSGGDVIVCIREARRFIATYIHHHGDGPVPIGFNDVIYKSVGWGMWRVGDEDHPLLYSDAMAVLQGFETKLAEEGYRECSARVLRTGGGAYLGDSMLVDIEHRERGRGRMRGG